MIGPWEQCNISAVPLLVVRVEVDAALQKNQMCFSALTQGVLAVFLLWLHCLCSAHADCKL